MCFYSIKLQRDHVLCAIGSETLTVEMPFQDNFTVKTYIGIDSPEDIAQKISSRVTEVTAPYMTLFIR